MWALFDLVQFVFVSLFFNFLLQMGSEFKGEIMNVEIAQVLKQWHAQVRDRRKKQDEGRIPKQSPPFITSTDQSHRISLDHTFSLPDEANYITSRSEITEELQEN